MNWLRLNSTLWISEHYKRSSHRWRRAVSHQPKRPAQSKCVFRPQVLSVFLTIVHDRLQEYVKLMRERMKEKAAIT